MRKPFNPLQAAILRSLAAALFHGEPMVITPKQVVASLQRQFGLMHGGKPEEIGTTLYAICVVLGGPLFLLLGSGFGANRIRRVLSNAKIDVLQDMARLRGVIYCGYYGHWQGKDPDVFKGQDENKDNPVLAQINYTLPKFRDRTAPGEIAITPVDRDLHHTDLVAHDAIPAEVDVIVIGSGAGGSVAAANLAGHGHEVLVIEAGSLWTSADINHEERSMTAQLFVDGALQNTLDHDVIVFQARCVGGGTVINNGIALRVNQPGMTHLNAQDVFEYWDLLGAPVDTARFDRAYDEVSKRLSIAPIDPRSGRHNGPHLLRGWAAYAATSSDPYVKAAPANWFSKNYGPDAVAPCVYCGYCNTGCAYGRKNGMVQSFLLDAHAKGAKILADAQADAILWRDNFDDAGKQVADGVAITLSDGTHRIIKARKGVVVAAGTLASSRLMRKSGFRQSGSGISLNIACPVIALMPEEVRAWDEDQMATYVDCGDFLLESHFQPPMSMAAMVPGWMHDHAARMRNYSRLTSAGVLFPADRRGHLEDRGLSLKLRPGFEMPVLRRALATLAKVHFAAGALEVYPALLPGQTLYPGDDIDAFFEEAIFEADDVTLSSSHPHGGNARNADPAKGVVDLECRVHGTSNVLVTDASTFTSCIRVNAQLTTMAMAWYATEADPF